MHGQHDAASFDLADALGQLTRTHTCASRHNNQRLHMVLVKVGGQEWGQAVRSALLLVTGDRRGQVAGRPMMTFAHLRDLPNPIPFTKHTPNTQQIASRPWPPLRAWRS